MTRKRSGGRTKDGVCPKLLAKAKELYLQYYSYTRIAEVTGLPRTTVAYHASNHWKVERELEKAELFDHMSSAKKVQFTNITQASIQIMERALLNLASRKQPPTIQEATKASEIMATLDKITRLDDGKPTEITEDKPFSVIEIQQKLIKDPFYSAPEEIEFKETTKEE